MSRFKKVLCGDDGGYGAPMSHRCTCVREKGHPLDSDRPHGCSCGAAWADKTANDVQQVIVEETTERRYVIEKRLVVHGGEEDGRDTTYSWLRHAEYDLGEDSSIDRKDALLGIVRSFQKEADQVYAHRKSAVVPIDPDYRYEYRLILRSATVTIEEIS